MEPRTPETVIDLGEARSQRAAVGVSDMPRVTTHDRIDRVTLLHKVAVLVNSSLDLDEVLRHIADLALEASGAQRCSIFLLDDETVEPVVAIGRRPNDDLWSAFRQMGPVRREDVPDAWETLLDHEVVAIEDARESDRIPRTWVELFDIRGLILVPMFAADEPCGAFALDYPGPHRFDEQELRLLEAVAASAGTAVRNARLYAAAAHRAALQEALAGGISTLVSTQGSADLLMALVDAYADLLGARVCAIGLFDAATRRITTIAARGGTPRSTPIPFATVPDRILEPLTSTWADNPRQTVTFGADPWFAEVAGRSAGETEKHLVLPLVASGVPRGAVLVGFKRDDTVDQEARAAARALADLAVAALERADMLERLGRHARQMEVLYTVSSAIAEGADSLTVVDRLNGMLQSEGVQVVSIRWSDPDLAPGRLRFLDDNRAADSPDEIPESVSVPMLLGGRAVGDMRVRPADLADDTREFLEAVGRGVAEVASRGALRSAVERAERDRAIATERDRIADDLHDTVGSLFVAIGLSANRAVPRLPATSPWVKTLGRIADLAASGKWEIDQAIRALAFVPAADRGLPTALGDLARSFEEDSGIRALVEITGDTHRLNPRIERALYRVAHESLVNAWRHARCGLVQVALKIGDTDAMLSVRDDGKGLGDSTATARPGIGLASMRRVMEEIAGDLRVRNARPRGFVVEATAPLPARVGMHRQRS